jgi:hypothetical protein
MTEPVPVGELLPGVLQEVIDRAGPGYDRWAEQVAATGYCAHPVRLRGQVEHADPQTGEVRTVYSTDREPEARCSRPAATAGPRSAPLAQPPTRPISSTCSPRGCAGARASPRRSAGIRGCS